MRDRHWNFQCKRQLIMAGCTWWRNLSVTVGRPVGLSLAREMLKLDEKWEGPGGELVLLDGALRWWWWISGCGIIPSPPLFCIWWWAFFTATATSLILKLKVSDLITVNEENPHCGIITFSGPIVLEYIISCPMHQIIIMMMMMAFTWSQCHWIVAEGKWTCEGIAYINFVLIASVAVPGGPAYWARIDTLLPYRLSYSPPRSRGCMVQGCLIQEFPDSTY